MSVGYVYCMSNPCMAGLYKIGYTERSIEERLQEANVSDTWRPPMPYILEFAKCVKEPNQKEKTIHTILNKFRVNPKREFFRVELDQVKLLFDLMDGLEQPTETDTDGRLIGDEVINLFLDGHVYPPNLANPEPVQWTKIASVFQEWKRNNGYSAGATLKLREVLSEAYGKPNRGEGWTTFRLKMD